MVSVVIPTARSYMLSKTIESLKNQKQKDFEILVVDNSLNPDESRKIKEISKKHNVRHVKEEDDGLHNARNRGVLEAKFDIVVFCDDDTIADENLIKYLLEPFQMFNRVGAVGGKVVPIFDSEIPEHMKYLKHSYLSLLDWGDEIKEVPYINGNNIAVSKEAYLDAGGVNPDAFQIASNIWERGDGESGLCRKLLQKGWKIIYTPHAVIKHNISKSRMSVESLKKYAFKHGIQMSYSKFFGGNFPPTWILISRSFAFMMLSILNKIISKSISYPRNVRYEVESELFRARALYEFKLSYSKKLRKHVSKTDWISDKIQKVSKI